MYLVTAEEVQTMDRMTIESFGIPGQVLMENAGRSATQMLFNTFPDLHLKKVGIVAGRGNNGGDGFVIARYLKKYGIKAAVYLLSRKSAVTGDAKTNLKLLSALEIPIIELPDTAAFDLHKTRMIHQEIWVDAILGTGLSSEVKGYFKDIIHFINQSGRPVFSIDIPSGLDSNTGQPHGICIQAKATATFAFAKAGHILYPGADYTGTLGIADIGIPEYIVNEVAPKQSLITPELLHKGFKPRKSDAHKGTAGHVLVLGGSPGKTGAAAMTAMSALKSGAGLVTLGIPASLNPVLESKTLEVMTEPLAETKDGMLSETSLKRITQLFEGKTCVAIGPGLGMSQETGALVRNIISNSEKLLVIDADGLNHVADNTDVLKNLKAPAILTPHPGEMARLTNSTPATIQKDRVGSARDFAVSFGVYLVLKGAKTVIANPDGNVFINPTGNSGMASGGMGDILTGIIAGLVSQGYSPEYAAIAGVFLHGAAADTLSGKTGHAGILASEVMAEIPGAFSQISKKALSPEMKNRLPELLGL